MSIPVMFGQNPVSGFRDGFVKMLMHNRQRLVTKLTTTSLCSSEQKIYNTIKI